VRGRLVGDDVDRGVQLQQRRQQLRGVAEDADRERAALVARRDRHRHGLLQRGRLDVEVAVVDASLDARLVALDADDDTVVHRHGERLGAAHPAQAGGDGDGAGERPAEPLVRHGRERLEGALEDALGADVDPGAGGHLAVHGQPEVLEPAELLPVGPVAHQVGVGDQHPRRPLVGPHHADRLARLDQHRLVVAEAAQGAHEGVVRLPAPRRPPGPAVHDQVLGPLGHLRVQVVHQHPQRRLRLPRLLAVSSVPRAALTGRAPVVKSAFNVLLLIFCAT
jgi:hypothetical protein